MFMLTLAVSSGGSSGGSYPRDDPDNPGESGDREQTSHGGPDQVAHGRAAGGPVKRGQPYIIGERGPELFVPKSHGFISPNSELNKTEKHEIRVVVEDTSGNVMVDKVIKKLGRRLDIKGYSR